MKSVREEAETSLKMAAQKMKEQYDRSKRDAPEFKVRDLVLLNMKNLRTTRQMKKLENLRDGPFKVLKEIGAAVTTIRSFAFFILSYLSFFFLSYLTVSHLSY